MTDSIRITDVSPRDGLQNEPHPIPTEQKIELVRRLIAARVDEIEVSSFVSAKWIPQLGDAEAVFDGIALEKPPGLVCSALVPNSKGMESALRVNEQARLRHGVSRLIDRVAVFTAASETFARRNTNASIAETIERFAPVLAAARAAGLGVRGYVSCAVACPFEGDIAPDRVKPVVASLLRLGVDEIDLADTIGAATPDAVERLIEAVAPEIPAGIRLTLHLHDTRAAAVACALRAMDLGVHSFDAAAGGLGGCPYATAAGKRAPGNLATETLLAAIRSTGRLAAADDAKLASAAHFARSLRSG